MICVICAGENFVKNGFHKGYQRYKCKNCGYQLTKGNAPKNSQETINMAMALWGYSFSVVAITKLLSIDRSTLYRWVKDHYKGAVALPVVKVRDFLKFNEDICEKFGEKDYKIAQDLLLNVRSFKKENETFLALIEQQFQDDYNRELIKFRERSHRQMMSQKPWLYDDTGDAEFRKLIIKKD